MTEKSNQSLVKRGFNLPHVFDRNIIILLVVYAITLLYILSNVSTDGYFHYSYYAPQGFNNLSIITFIAGVLVSFVQFRFLQVKTKCLTILSLGETRKNLFRKKFWFPLLVMVLMTIGYYIIILCVDEKLNKFFSTLYDEYFANILISLLPLFVGYTVGAFARIVSGKTSETIVFGASVCAFPFALFSAVDAVFALTLKGYYTAAADYYAFSNYGAAEGHPVTTVLSLFDPLYTLNTNISGFSNSQASTGLWFETPALYIIKNVIWIAVFIGIIFLVENHFVKNFKAEYCDKSGKNKFVRVMCSVTSALLVVALSLLAVYQNLWADALPARGLSLVVGSLIWALILTLILTALLYRKGIKLRYSFLGVGITTALSVVIYIISVTGCFGYSTYMPETENIKSVMINDVTGVLPAYSSDYFVSAQEALSVDISFKTKEEIEFIKDIHKFIATDKNYDTTETFTIIYELEDGGLVYRTYPHLSDEACEKLGTVWGTDTVRNFYKVILNQDEELNSTGLNTYWISWEKAFSFNTNSKIINGSGYYDDGYYGYNESSGYRTIAAADSLVVYSKDGEFTCITNEEISSETMEKLKKALYMDYMNMSHNNRYKSQEQVGVISLASCVALLEEEESGWWDEEEEETLTAKEVLENNEDHLYRFLVTSDMVNTINVLKDADVYKYFASECQIADAHLIDSSKIISWMNSDLFSYMEDSLPGLTYSWDDYYDTYLRWGCGYLPSEEAYQYSEYSFEPISESDIEKITPQEAEMLREKACMIYNAGQDCEFLVMKHTDGSANMLVIPK